MASDPYRPAPRRRVDPPSVPAAHAVWPLVEPRCEDDGLHVDERRDAAATSWERLTPPSTVREIAGWLFDGGESDESRRAAAVLDVELARAKPRRTVMEAVAAILGLDAVQEARHARLG